MKLKYVYKNGPANLVMTYIIFENLTPLVTNQITSEIRSITKA